MVIYDTKQMLEFAVQWLKPLLDLCYIYTVPIGTHEVSKVEIHKHFNSPDYVYFNQVYVNALEMLEKHLMTGKFMYEEFKLVMEFINNNSEEIISYGQRRSNNPQSV